MVPIFAVRVLSTRGSPVIVGAPVAGIVVVDAVRVTVTEYVCVVPRSPEVTAALTTFAPAARSIWCPAVPSSASSSGASAPSRKATSAPRSLTVGSTVIRAVAFGTDAA